MLGLTVKSAALAQQSNPSSRVGVQRGPCREIVLSAVDTKFLEAVTDVFLNLCYPCRVFPQWALYKHLLNQ